MIYLECHACEREVGIHCLSPSCDLAVCSSCGTLLSRDGRRRETRGEPTTPNGRPEAK